MTINSASGWAPSMAVGRYQLVAPIAAGGMAEIWLARQPGVQGFDRVLVIKRLIATLESDADTTAMFLTEARLAAQLNHPNVVQIFELGQHLGSFFIAMEYLDGENLATLRSAANRSGRPLPFAIAARLIAMAAEGLHYAHTRTSFDGKPLSIIHRDVSPQNLIVTYEGGVKLVDFGIAKVASEETTSGKLKGKIRYMSPEQGRAEPLDPRSDVFSLGMVLFEVVTNTRMFPKADELDLLRQVISDEPLPEARARLPLVPPALNAIIARALARDRADRFPDARALQLALEDYLRAEQAQVGSTEVSALMKSLFAERIAERRRLIEAAMAGEINPALVPHSFQAPSQSLERPPAPRAALWAGAGLIVAAGLSLGLLLGKPVPAPAPVPPAEVPAVRAVLEIDTEPTGAQIDLDGADQGAAPLKLVVRAMGDHKLTAALPGFLPGVRRVTVKSGEHVRVLIALEAEPKPAPPPDPVPAPAPAVRKKGKLNLSSKPWASVYLGKAKLGETPLTDVALPAGKHMLHLVNPERQIDTTIEVEIRPGETTSKKLKL